MDMQTASETLPDGTPTAVSIEVRPLTPHIGAEIAGVDLSRPLSQSQQDEIRRAWLDWQVLVFRNQKLTRERHKDFGRSFGPLHPASRRVGLLPAVALRRAGLDRG